MELKEEVGSQGRERRYEARRVPRAAHCWRRRGGRRPHLHVRGARPQRLRQLCRVRHRAPPPLTHPHRLQEPPQRANPPVQRGRVEPRTSSARSSPISIYRTIRPGCSWISKTPASLRIPSLAGPSTRRCAPTAGSSATCRQGVSWSGPARIARECTRSRGTTASSSRSCSPRARICRSCAASSSASSRPSRGCPS